MPERLAVFDLDNTLLKDPNLFDRSLHAEGGGYEPDSTRYNAPIDWVEQEVLEELGATYGTDSWDYLANAIRFYLRHNRGRRTHDDLTRLTVAGGHWPNPEDFYTFTPRFAHALGQAAYHLHCITYSPQFLAEHLLITQGIATPAATIYFDSVVGSTYSVDNTKRLTGEAATPGNKANSLRATFGETVTPDYALGDTETDIPMLQLARLAIAVNPSPGLRETAVQNGMTIVREAGERIDIWVPGKPRRDLSTTELTDMPPNEVIQLVH